MKKLEFKTRTINIKEESLNKLIDAAICCASVTRSNVSKAVGVSLSTSGKLLEAMDVCGFTNRIFDRSGERNGHEKIHIFSNDISVLILDFSSYKYSASIIFGHGEKVITEYYSYDPNVSFENNVLIFLSSLGKKISSFAYPVSAVCSIIADEPEYIMKTSHATASYIPRQADLQIIDDICNRFFKQNTIKLKHSEAVRCATKFNRIDQRITGNVSYIRLLDSFSAFYLPKKLSPIRFCAERLICNGIKFTEILTNSESSRDIATLLMKITNIMDSAYPTDSFIIEYDKSKFDEKTEKFFYLSFNASEAEPPIVEFWSGAAPLPHLGAGAFALSELIKMHIIGM